MDEDIDIEEHDILENPWVRNILPHIDRIKEEPMEYEDNYEEYTNDFVEENEGMNLYDESDNYVSEPDNASSPELSLNNRITLGTKPNIGTNLKYLQVSLEDWGPHLERSSCFCKECKTLFATRNALDSHNMVAHSFLVAMESPQEPTTPPQNHEYCNHCHKHFDDYNLLIQHLYDLIIAKKKAKNEAPTPSALEPTEQVTDVKTHVRASEKLMSCTICSYYTQYYHNMRRHRKTHHNVDTEMCQSVPFNPSCKFCKFTGSLKDYNNHIKLAHNDYYSKKVTKKKSNTTILAKTERTTLMKTQKENSVKFKCPKCKLTFSTLEAAKIHNWKAHKVKRVVVKTSKEAVVSNIRRRQTADRNFGPKDILFKCDLCPLHFINGLSSVNHASYPVHRADVIDSSWRCPNCKRLFRYQDRDVHLVQHQFTSIFKVYEVHQNIYSRVLYKCTKCDVYFDERFYLMHIRKKCNPSRPVEQCAICEIKVNNYNRHNQKHEVDKFIKSDFILISEYVSMLQRKVVQSENKNNRYLLTPKAVQECQNARKGNKMILYYCDCCKTYMRGLQRIQFHTSKQCRTFTNKKHCRICGLMFGSGRSIKRHMTIHESFNLELKDFLFYSVTSQKPKNPPIPNFPTCKKCNMHCLNIFDHKCGDTGKVCGICKDTFDLATIKMHVLHHKYMENRLDVENDSTEPSKKVKFQYERLKCSRDILFNCNQCGIASDQYDKVVDHCQKHFNNLTALNTTIMSCDVCSLNFEEDGYKRHRKLHLEREIDKNTFIISDYDYFMLLTDDWLKIFDPLPKEVTENILNNTIYLTRLIRMRLKFNGSPEYTLYKCDMCKNVIPPKDIETHAKNFASCANSKLKFECKLCGISFLTRPSLEEHTTLHASADITIDSFRIVSFNHPSDEKFNAKLLAESRKRYHKKDIKPKSSSQITREFNIKGPRLKTMKMSNLHRKIKKVRYFQCQKCFSCRLGKAGCYNHVCVTKKYAKVCIHCKYIFSAKGITGHYQKHQRMPNLTRENIIIVPFNSNKTTATHVTPNQNCKETKIYKCTCGIHFPSKQSVCKHLTKCSPGQRINCERCTKCSLNFPTNLLVNHVVNHHSSRDSKVMVYNVPKLFRCSHCRSLFLTKLSLSNHIRCCENINMKNNEAIKTILHKCRTCGVHFSSQAMGILHLNECHERTPHSICQKCGLKFFAVHMKEHLYLHHKKKRCQRGDFKIKILPRDENKSTGLIKNMILKKKQNIDQNNAQRLDIKNKPILHDKFQTKNLYKNLSTVRIASKRIASKVRSTINSSPDVIESLDPETDESNKLMAIFLCTKCDVHYCNESTLRKHSLKGHTIKRSIEVCETCDRRFTKNSLNIHNNRFKGKCKNIRTFINDDINREETGDEKVTEFEISNKNKRKEACDRDSETPKKRKLTSHDKGNDSDISDTIDVSTSTPKQIVYDFKLYKCGECKVHFMNQASCYKHTLNHVPMNPTEYIACKICNLQFRISSLSSHVRKHHSSKLNDDKVLIEEYSCFQGKSPKIDIYYATDKVQSKLVSTTTDDHDETPNGDDIDTATPNEHNCDQSINDVIESLDTVVEKPSSDSNDVKEGSIHCSETDDKIDSSEGVEIANSFNKPDEDISEVVISVADTDQLETEVRNEYACSFCDEKFYNNTSKEFHESLDHIDGKKDCPICGKNLNASILNEMHLGITNDMFTCCVCNEKSNVDKILEHSTLHKSE